MAVPSSVLVAQVTDTHLFAQTWQTLKDIKTAESLQSVLNQLENRQPRPDYLLLTGDLSQDETPESYDRLVNQIAPLGIPAYWLPGNHDSLAAMQERLQGEPFRTEKSFAAGEWRIILLNSRIPGRVEGALAPGELAWLEAQLRQYPQTPTLITLHHPPLPIGSEWMDAIALQNAEEFLALVDRHPQIKLVLFGHIHQEFEHQRREVSYLGSPSTCVQFQPHKQEFGIDSQAQPGFRLLKLFAGGRYETHIKRVFVKLGCTPLET